MDVGEAFSPGNIRHYETWIFLTFSIFAGSFCPPGSGSGFRIRIHWPYRIRIQSRSGSETLFLSDCQRKTYLDPPSWVHKCPVSERQMAPRRAWKGRIRCRPRTPASALSPPPSNSSSSTAVRTPSLPPSCELSPNKAQLAMSLILHNNNIVEYRYRKFHKFIFFTISTLRGRCGRMNSLFDTPQFLSAGICLDFYSNVKRGHGRLIILANGHASFSTCPSLCFTDWTRISQAGRGKNYFRLISIFILKEKFYKPRIPIF